MVAVLGGKIYIKNLQELEIGRGNRERRQVFGHGDLMCKQSKRERLGLQSYSLQTNQSKGKAFLKKTVL